MKIHILPVNVNTFYITNWYVFIIQTIFDCDQTAITHLRLLLYFLLNKIRTVMKCLLTSKLWHQSSVVLTRHIIIVINTLSFRFDSQSGYVGKLTAFTGQCFHNQFSHECILLSNRYSFLLQHDMWLCSLMLFMKLMNVPLCWLCSIYQILSNTKPCTILVKYHILALT